MRKYAKIVAICLIAVLSLGMLSACGGANYTGKDNSFMGMMHGISKSVQDTTETQTTTQNSTVYVNSYSSDSNNNNDQQTPNGDQQTPNGDQQTPSGDQQTPENNGGSGNTETPEEDLSNGINNYTTVCMSFNMLGYLSDTLSPPKERAPWILATIRKYDPDLLGAQEIGDPGSYNGNFDTYGYVVENLSEYESQNWHMVPNGQALFWKKARYEKKDGGFAAYGNEGRFGVNWALLYDKKDDITVLFTNIHFTPGAQGGTPQDAARDQEGLFLMNNVWKKYVGKDVALYATGDYNCSPGSSTITALTKSKFKCSAEVALNANHAPYIDHVFINGDIQECVNFHTSLETYEPEGVDPTESGKKYWPSDHRAVISYCNNSKRG